MKETADRETLEMVKVALAEGADPGELLDALLAACVMAADGYLMLDTLDVRIRVELLKRARRYVVT